MVKAIKRSKSYLAFAALPMTAALALGFSGSSPRWDFTASVSSRAALDSSAVPVEFRFYRELAPGDSAVAVLGTFNAWGNGGISRNARYDFLSDPEGDHLWVGTLDLLPGHYAYKFVTLDSWHPSIDDSYAHVTGWFTDPLNARSGGPYNDSFLSVSDPMIYYFLPLTGTAIADRQPTITAKIAVARRSRLALETLRFTLDGTEVPNAASLYDSTVRAITYRPPAPLSFGLHTATLRVMNDRGDAAADTIRFEVSKNIVSAPFTFMFDSRSPNFQFIGEITRVAVKGDFNRLGEDPMLDPDGDGVYTRTATMRVGAGSQYQIIINGGYYINDPDNPLLSLNYQTVAVKRTNSRPTFTDFSPRPGSLFLPGQSILFSAKILPSDSGYAINPNSLSGLVDNVPTTVTYESAGDGFIVHLSVSNFSEGRHVVEFQGADVQGNAAWPATLAVGVYPLGSGFHYVDAVRDDLGPGKYLYPAGVPPGSADILGFHVQANAARDSLRFAIEMANISDFTRVGFWVTHGVEGEKVDAMPAVELKIPEWNGRGVYAMIAPPTSSTLNPEQENVLYLSRLPLQKGAPIAVKTSASEFRFAVALADLENILGNFNQKWYFSAFTYFVNATGPVEVGPAEKAEFIDEDPDVYDVAFISDPVIQQRLLANYIVSYGIGGPRIATIGSDHRGAQGVAPSEIDPELGKAPVVKLLASGGELLRNRVVVAGTISDSSITSATLRVNLTDYPVTVTNGFFSREVTLQEGENRIIATVNYDGTKVSRSQPIVYRYVVDHAPVVQITTSVIGNTVTLDGSSTSDPDNDPFSATWSADASNPQAVTLTNPHGLVTTFTAPTSPGEYYFTLSVADPQDTSWARAVIVVDSTGAHAPDLATWHPAWIDTAVVYEIFIRTFSPVGELRAITGRMAELKDLGVDCLWLMPIHPSPTTHGYAVTDYFGINPEYGTKEEFRDLVKTAHRYGIRVVLDHVINHTSFLHPFMVDASTYGARSPYYDFYVWNPDGSFHHLFTWVDLPTINFESESTRDYLIRMAKYWVQEFDIDGYRCDVAWAIDNNYLGIRPSGAAYWQRFRRELKKMKPDILLLAEASAEETNHFDQKFDSAYDWPWYTRVKNVLSGTGTIADLDATTQQYLDPSYPKHALPFRFLENHDEERLVKAFGVAPAKISAALLFTSPGLLMVYAGQEVGELTYRGVITWSDPNNLRPFYKRLIRIRKENPALSQGRFITVPNTASNQLYSYLRRTTGNTALVNLNLSSSPVTARLAVPLSEIPFDSTANFYLNDVLNGVSLAVRGSQLANYPVTLPAYGAQIFVFGTSPITGVADGLIKPPLEFSLAQNYPNPFNPTTAIHFTIGGTRAVHATLRIYNLLGQVVRTLVDEKREPGRYMVQWDGRDGRGLPVATGVYLYRLEAGSFVKTKKMLSVK